MNIGVDFDGVIADTNKVRSQWIKRNLGITIPLWLTDKTSCLKSIGVENYQKMSKTVYERPSTMEAKPLPGVKTAFRILSKQGDIHIITSRLPHRVEYAREWLQKNGLLLYIKAIHRESDVPKGILAEKLNISVLIDDDIRHLKGVQKVKKIWFKSKAQNLNPPRGIVLIRSWKEITKYLVKLH